MMMIQRTTSRPQLAEVAEKFWASKKFIIFVLRKKGSKTNKRMKEEERKAIGGRQPERCIGLTRLTLVCEVIWYGLVQVRQNLKKRSLSPAGFRFVCWDQSLAVAESHVSPAATSWF